LITNVNVAEFYYKTCQKLGKQTADTWYFQLGNTELAIVYATEELVRGAGLEKCRHSPSLSLADCFALALAKAEGALLLTTDGELAKIKDVRTKYIQY
jgi:predicted nucleic acid-binding protein